MTEQAPNPFLPQGEGERASEMMSGMRGATEHFETRSSPENTPSLGILSEIHQRLAAVEASQRDIHEKIDAATKSGVLDPDLLAHVAHVMKKYFPHDMADTISTEPPRAKFDAFTGAPLQ